MSNSRTWLSCCLAVTLLLLALPSVAGTSDASCARLASRLAQLEGVVAADPSPGGFVTSFLGKIAGRQAEQYADDCVGLNQVQVLGSHNSYHQRPRPILLRTLLLFSSLFTAWEYDHQPLAEQFSTHGIRQIELDVFADPDGGLYAFRAGLVVINQDPFSPLPEMYEPGMKVLHVQDLDFETTCPTLVQCLEAIRAWSEVNSGHLPIVVLVEVKDDPIDDPLNLGFVVPLPFDAAQFDGLDAEIRSVFPADWLITPDDLRVPGWTLEQSVLQQGWPSLGEARGRVLFALDNGGDKRLTYLDGRPNGEGRVLFTPGIPGESDAAFLKRNDPFGSFDEIQQRVQEGYLIRTRADSDTVEARFDLTARREAALASGAQLVSSDYPVPDPDFGTGYRVEIPGGLPGRCNPLNAPQGCRNAALEP